MFSNIFKNAICLPSRAFSTGKCFCIDIVCITILFSGERERVRERQTETEEGRERWKLGVYGMEMLSPPPLASLAGYYTSPTWKEKRKGKQPRALARV